MKSLFFDPIKDPPDDDGISWHVCRSTDEAVEWVVENGMPNHISLDFDIDGNIGTAFAAWIMTRPEIPVISYHGNNRTNADILVNILRSRS